MNEFLADWNSSMPMKIKESDLKSPTEIFFRKCLLLILKKMSINTIAFEVVEDNKEKVIKSQMKLCKIIDGFCNICIPDGKQKTFVYFDLIKPNSKKMLSVLTYLLNYVKYFHMVKEATIDSVDEQLKEKYNLVTARNDLKREIEWSKNNEETFKQQIDDLKKKIPKLNKDIKDLSQKESNVNEAIQKTQEESHQVEMNLMTLREEINTLSRSIVTDEEANFILRAVENLKTQLKENDQIIFAARKKNDEISEMIKGLSNTIESIENIISSFKIDLTELRKLKLFAANLEKHVKTLKLELQNNRPKLKQTQMDFEILSKESYEIRSQIHLLKEKHEIGKKELKKVAKEKQAIWEKLNDEEIAAMETRESLTKEAECLFKIASSTLMYINNNC